MGQNFSKRIQDDLYSEIKGKIDLTNFEEVYRRLTSGATNFPKGHTFVNLTKTTVLKDNFGNNSQMVNGVVKPGKHLLLLKIKIITN